MTDARLLFLGRTGVGKSSLINFLAGEERCDTDPYRACTKEPSTVTVKYGTNEYELIDTPGLCEGGSELDSLYLGLIDQYLLDDRILPNLVFKSDDTRLRSEDYQLINTLLRRYGNRIFVNGTLMLTFAGNLQSDFNFKIHKRVKLITSAIYGIQTSLGMEIFNGFPRITLLDSELKSFFEIEMPHNHITMDILNLAIREKRHDDMAQRLGVHPEISESIIEKLISQRDAAPSDSLELLSAINRFPFHNLVPEQSHSDLSTTTAKAIMTGEPKSVYELAQLLSSDGFKETSINIEKGVLKYSSTAPYRKFTNSDQYADCISVLAFASREATGQLNYSVNYKISSHIYTDSGELDIQKIFKSADEAESIISFQPKSYAYFKRLIGHPEYLLNEGLIAFRNSVEEALSNEEIWQL